MKFNMSDPLPCCQARAESAAIEEEKFFLQNRTAGYIGNSPLWWRAGGHGYTPWLAEAERFTAAEADRIIRSTRGSHEFVKHRVDDVYRLAKQTVDVQDLRRVDGRTA